jgi:hypothetical protein
MLNIPKLIFVYNADSGLVNALKDCTHKLLNPKTYPCKLCDLTYGAFTERRKWKAFRKNFDAEMIFLHADEFYEQYRSKFLPKYNLPIVLIQKGYTLDVFIDESAMHSCENLNQFIDLVESRFEKSNLSENEKTP